MNWILVPVHNGLHYTQRAIKAFRKQDMGNVKTLVIDNASTDGTTEFLRAQYPFVITIRKDPPLSVSASWNKGLELLFQDGIPHVLVVNNDVDLLPETYRMLWEYMEETKVGIVTATGVSSHEQMQINTDWYPAPSPHPYFSCFLISRATWEKVGKFDEHFQGAYCEDLDYHLRMHQLGVDAVNINIPFVHYISGTMKAGDEKLRLEIEEKAERNRAYFSEKWGVTVGSPEYYELFKEAPPEEPSQLPPQPQP